MCMKFLHQNCWWNHFTSTCCVFVYRDTYVAYNSFWRIVSVLDCVTMWSHNFSLAWKVVQILIICLAGEVLLSKIYPLSTGASWLHISLIPTMVVFLWAHSCGKTCTIYHCLVISLSRLIPCSFLPHISRHAELACWTSWSTSYLHSYNQQAAESTILFLCVATNLI